MKAFHSLFARIIMWCFLNLAIVAIVLAVFFALQFQLDLQELLGRHTTDRLRMAGRHISYDLARSPRTHWDAVLAHHAEIYQVDFVLVLRNKNTFVSKPLTIPDEVMARVERGFFPKRVAASLKELSNQEVVPYAKEHQRMSDIRNRSQDKMVRDMQPGSGPPISPLQEIRSPKSFAPRQNSMLKHRMIMRTRNPTRYWAGTRIRLPLWPRRPPQAAILIAVSDTLTGNGFFMDPFPWIVATGTVLLISVLWWVPLVRNITQPLGRMTLAAEKVARGRFDVRTHESRADEIGRLGGAINHMTDRLAGFVNGQKRFLGDVAHELGSPIARIRFGLGILEQQVDGENRDRVTDVMADVAQMSNLVNELLSFSRAEINPERVQLTATGLLALVERVVRREASPPEKIDIQVQPGQQVMADPELLSRALANLVRNAVRYAGSAGPIVISASNQEGHVQIEVRDSGPGVPDSMLDQLFEPFYRPEPSRDRASGGAGLGLAIVNTCIQACNGHVSARNLEPCGFAVTMTLKAASASIVSAQQRNR